MLDSTLEVLFHKAYYSALHLAVSLDLQRCPGASCGMKVSQQPICMSLKLCVACSLLVELLRALSLAASLLTSQAGITVHAMTTHQSQRLAVHPENFACASIDCIVVCASLLEPLDC